MSDLPDWLLQSMGSAPESYRGRGRQQAAPLAAYTANVPRRTLPRFEQVPVERVFPIQPATRTVRSEAVRPLTPEHPGNYTNFADFAMQRLAEPIASDVIAARPPPMALGGSPSRSVPADATYETTPQYRAQRGPALFQARYRSQALPNGAHIRTSEPLLDRIPEPPMSARMPVAETGFDENAAFNSALARARAQIQQEFRDTASTLPRPGRPAISQVRPAPRGRRSVP